MPNFAFLSEPQTFQTDVHHFLKYLDGQYSFHLNSDDLQDPNLPLVQSRSYGGTLVLWKCELDPFVTVHLSPSSAFQPIILKLPGCRISAHVAIYLPTAGKDSEFISELADLQNCLEEIIIVYNDPVIYIRGDGNVNEKNTRRVSLLKHFIRNFNFKQIKIIHPTYHHFTGEGNYDSNIDILLHSDMDSVSENISLIKCKLENPEILSHHDIILSNFTIPISPPLSNPTQQLVIAPRVTMERTKIFWAEDSLQQYQDYLTSNLESLRQTWQDPNSKSSTRVLLNSTNALLSLSAEASNKTSVLNCERPLKPQKTPRGILKAKYNLNNCHKKFKTAHPTIKDNAKTYLSRAKKAYQHSIRKARLQDSINRDTDLFEVATSKPQNVYKHIKKLRKTKTSKVEQLEVGDKLYYGAQVPDGFYDSMTALKTCDMEDIWNNQYLAPKLTNYEHILKICKSNKNIPQISTIQASKILARMKKDVIDYFNITALHYINAGEVGLVHFTALLNTIISDVENATIEELNTAFGIILYKGHSKAKTSHRSYRTISTCPFLAKALDIYLRDLFQPTWDSVTAETQYQATGSSHELASLLITEIVQHSLNVANKPLYLLVLDAESAYDRCLRQILCCELFDVGVAGSALLLINNRLSNRSTVYEWDNTVMGPAPDTTGFEQGGVNSGDYYKLYNNQQLKSAQRSNLGVDIKSSVISAVGCADDVILASNSIDDLQMLARLTEYYCSKYRVKLVPSKTKLLPVFKEEHQLLVDYAKLINPVTINGQTVEFVSEAEHVGVIRSVCGNMPNILARISSHKKALGSVSSAGLARNHRANPAACLKVHQVYCTAVLFSGLSSLLLTKPEVQIIENHFKLTLQNIQRLNKNTPRSIVYFLAGSLPGEAILHLKQLSLFSMICRLPDDPLNLHARSVLTTAPASAHSWFQQVRDLCLQYCLPHPLKLLESPISKEEFKKIAKSRVIEYWQNKLKNEATSLPSLHYFHPEFHSLQSPHPIWTAAGSNPYETSKSSILALMISGRYYTEQLTKHWSPNRSGYCLSPSCVKTPGTLEHLLIECAALQPVRDGLYKMWISKSAQFPPLQQFLLEILSSPTNVKVQFILDPTAFPVIIILCQHYGQDLTNHIYYLVRTFVFYIHKKKQILLGRWPSHKSLITPADQIHTISDNLTHITNNKTNSDILDNNSTHQGINITNIILTLLFPGTVSSVGSHPGSPLCADIVDQVQPLPNSQVLYQAVQHPGPPPYGQLVAACGHGIPVDPGTGGVCSVTERPAVNSTTLHPTISPHMSHWSSGPAIGLDRHLSFKPGEAFNFGV